MEKYRKPLSFLFRFWRGLLSPFDWKILSGQNLRNGIGFSENIQSGTLPLFYPNFFLLNWFSYYEEFM